LCVFTHTNACMHPRNVFVVCVCSVSYPILGGGLNLSIFVKRFVWKYPLEFTFFHALADTHLGCGSVLVVLLTTSVRTTTKARSTSSGLIRSLVARGLIHS
jgi:hypothetical protein